MTSLSSTSSFSSSSSSLASTSTATKAKKTKKTKSKSAAIQTSALPAAPAVAIPMFSESIDSKDLDIKGRDEKEKAQSPVPMEFLVASPQTRVDWPIAAFHRGRPPSCSDSLCAYRSMRVKKRKCTRVKKPVALVRDFDGRPGVILTCKSFV